MITPALATVDDAYAWAKSSFIEWLHNSYTAGHGEGDSLLQQLFKPEDGECNHVWVYNSDDYKYCERCDLGFEEYYNSKYSNYVSDLQSDLGTDTLIGGGRRGGGLRIYWKPEYEDVVFTVATGTGSGTYGVEGNTTYFHVESQCNVINISSTPANSCTWIAPFSCVYEYGVESNYGNLTSETRPWAEASYGGSGEAVVGKKLWFFSSPFLKFYNPDYTTTLLVSDLAIRYYVDVFPVEGAILPTSQDISINSRPSSITGDYGILGDDGTIITVDKTIVDEGHSIVYNPVTNTTYNYTDYAYDYSDRSYNLTLEDGSSMKVVYGDENITIQEGDTVYNVYYLTSGSEGGSGSGGSGDNGSGGIGGAIGGLFDVLGEIIYGLIEGTINLATKALSALTGLLDLLKQFGESIISFFGGYTDFLGAVFPFLPEETFTILNLGLILMIAAAVFKKFL